METPSFNLPKHFEGLNGYAKFFSSLPKPVDYSKKSEEELLEELRNTPDFDKFVFPNSWYSKFNLPEKKCLNMKEFLIESPWMKSFKHSYIGKEEIPAKPGGLRPVLPLEEIKVETVQKNLFSDAPLALTNQTEPSGQPEIHES